MPLTFEFPWSSLIHLRLRRQKRPLCLLLQSSSSQCVRHKLLPSQSTAGRCARCSPGWPVAFAAVSLPLAEHFPRHIHQVVLDEHPTRANVCRKKLVCNYGCVWTRSIVPKAFPAAYSIETPSVQNVFFIDMAIVIKTLFEYNVENCRDGNKAHYCGQHPSRSHVYPV